MDDAVPYVNGNPATRSISSHCTEDEGFGEFIVGGVDLDGDANNRADLAIADGLNRRIVIFDQDLAALDCFGRSRADFGNSFDFTGDFDGDGSVDMIVTHSAERNDAFIFLNDGQGRFGNGAGEADRGYHVLIDQPPAPKAGVAGIGDFDGDGRPDVASFIKYAGGDVEVTVYY